MVLVTTDVVRHSMLGMAYTPDDIGRVMNGARIAPMSQKAPESWMTCSR